jgi:hypothetical protein
MHVTSCMPFDSHVIVINSDISGQCCSISNRANILLYSSSWNPE